jgi:hypothetical protein
MVSRQFHGPHAGRLNIILHMVSALSTGSSVRLRIAGVLFLPGGHDPFAVECADEYAYN